MVNCASCGQNVTDSQARFCPSCGKPMQGAVSSQEIQTKQTLKEKWLDNHFRGTIKSDTGELWTYDRGTVTCQEGNQKGLQLSWTGSQLSSDVKDAGSATWDGRRVVFKWPQFNEEFYSYVWEEGSHLFRNERGISRVNPFKYVSYVNWTYSKDALAVAEGSDYKEGALRKVEILGDFPMPIVLVCAMYTRAQKLLQEAIAKSKISYKRCGKLATQSSGAALLCPNCEPDLCFVCLSPLKGSKYPGKVCRTCAARKSTCIRCNDPLQGSKVEGFLCTNCGLGRLGDNCCKLSASSLNPFV